MQNHHHANIDDKFAMNFANFDTDNLFNASHMANMGVGGLKRSAHDAGLDRDAMGLSSDDDSDFMKKEVGVNGVPCSRENMIHHQQTSLDSSQKQTILPNGKKTKGRVKIKMEFIDNKLRRYTTFSKRKTGIMKKAYELSTLTGTQVMLLVASETGHVYTFATRKLQPMITSEAGKALIQTCLNSPDPPSSHQYQHHDQRMSATGYEETELTYAVPDDDGSKVRQMMYSAAAGGSPSPAASSGAGTMHHQGNAGPVTSMAVSSAPHLAVASAAAAAAALHHYGGGGGGQHPHAPSTPHIAAPSPHLTPPGSHPMAAHHHHLAAQLTNNHSEHSNSLHQHSSHLHSQTPLPPHSPLPPNSPMGTPSPTSPYHSLHHHHPHHHIQTHSR